MKTKASYGSRLSVDLKRNRYIYMMAIPVILYYIIFCYLPMYGVVVAFQDFNPRQGFFGSDWVGFQWFTDFFKSHYFQRILRNTFCISFLDIILGFPAPIIFALLLNEITNKYFKKSIQTITYLPNFISNVVIAGIMINFLGSSGVITNLLTQFGFEKQNILGNPDYFWIVYVISGIWQGFGWGSIIYLAVISGINPDLYEAATIDGAGKWKQMWNVTLPSLMPTIIILFIMRVGSVLSVGAEKILLLYSPATYSTADVISTYVYRKGLIDNNYSYSVAIGLFNSVINLIFLVTFNKISKKVSETSLW